VNHQGQDPADSILASYTPNMADHIDTLEDRVKERLAKMKAQNPTLDLDQLAKLTAEVVEQTIKHEGDSQMLRHRRDDTLDESLLALATNRSPDSLTADCQALHQPKHRQALHKGGHLGTADGVEPTDWPSFTHPTERKSAADLQRASLAGA
jgi:cell division protein ZapA (FtsZ GTPase activity inhibitor)